MVRNYLKIAFRNIVKQKSYALINILGLTASLTVALLMLLWVQDEWSTDKFHENDESLYRIKRTIPQEGNELQVVNGIPYPVLVAAQKELPEVERFMPLGHIFDETIQYGESSLRKKGAFGNTAYFEAFSYPILIGDISELDKKTNAIAISQSTAKSLFGNVWQSTGLGKTVHIHDNGDFSIEAIFDDFPSNSSIQSDYFYSIESYLKDNDWVKEWTNSGMQGGLLLADGADPVTTGQKIEEIFQSHQEGDLKEGIVLQRYSDHYLYGQYDHYGKVEGGRIEYVRTFGIAALLLLIISCINFVNLATARASKRTKEVGVRKTIGAARKSLITQFMIESAVMTLLSMVIAYLVAELMLPQVRLLTGKALSFDLNQPSFWLGFIVIFFLTTFLAGAYPSLVLSGFKPLHMMKGSTQNKTTGISLRKGLVIGQFVLALLLIVSALVVEKQVEYIKNKNLGIDKENLLVISKDENITSKYEVLKNDLIGREGIAKVTTAGPTPIDMQASTSGVSWPGKRPDQENQEFQILWAESNFLDVFDVGLAQGRFYREDAVMDTTTIVLNETAVDIMGLDEPVGKSIQWWGKPRQIIGVISDFHNRTLYEDIEPMAILLDPEGTWSLFVKTEAGQTNSALSSLKESFSSIVPQVPLHYDFVDHQYLEQYKSEELTSSLAKYFAMISILIACMGLLGLATFYAEQKTKEIGIRKVLGASVLNLIGLLSREFLILVCTGLLIGILVSWYLLRGWLGNFKYGVDLNWMMFIVPTLIAILVAGATVGIQALRASLVNPVKSLRDE